ncbi:hypothetical protein N7471_002250 [Penicillium samsonianum]|uniref:uncharacterized protein n=1 Tax=Penicillium samsonianum TaxID=1882272 RepID=UPI0025467AE9|nr:uncharacterized protein N7471_002250 [Penicillium samsonianum]KAJ6142797.1 hypothetical protein N7471_002250 [Penicillium samsonianum]
MKPCDLSALCIIGNCQLKYPVFHDRVFKTFEFCGELHVVSGLARSSSYAYLVHNIPTCVIIELKS